MALLLASLWSVFNVFNRLFETAPVKATQARLVAGIVRQLSDDLQSAIEDNLEESQGVRRFGLEGTSHWIRINVLQPISPEKSPPPESSLMEGRGYDAGPRAPELREICYAFAAPLATQPREGGETGYSQPPMPGGVVRTEVEIEAPLEVNPALAAIAPDSSSTIALAAADGLTLPPDLLSLAAGPSATSVPEIEGLEFRYFDGAAWSGSWSSLDRKSLPVAIEVTLQVRDLERQLPRPAVEAEAAMLDESEMLDGTSLSSALAAGPKHRFVIRVPRAKSRPPVRASDLLFDPYAARLSVPQPVRVPRVEARPMAVPRWQAPTPASAPSRADQPMRNRQ